MWDQDALLLRKDSIVQVSKQRDDGWIYGSVVLNASKDEGADLKRYGADGVSLSSGWFPEKVSDIPTADQLKEMQKAMGAGDDALAMPKYWDRSRTRWWRSIFRYRRAARNTSACTTLLL